MKLALEIIFRGGERRIYCKTKETLKQINLTMRYRGRREILERENESWRDLPKIHKSNVRVLLLLQKLD